MECSSSSGQSAEFQKGLKYREAVSVWVCVLYCVVCSGWKCRDVVEGVRHVLSVWVWGPTCADARTGKQVSSCIIHYLLTLKDISH